MAQIATACKDAGLQCERVVGVNGAALSPETVRAVTVPSCRHMCSPGMVGCALSHMTCWRAVVDRGLPLALVLEDDATLVPEFSAKLDRVLEHAPPDWHIITLGCFMCGPAFQRMFNVRGTAPLFDNGVVRELKTFGGTHAYLVSQAGARHLVQHASKVKFHIDLQMSSTKGLRIYGVHEDLAFQGGETATSALVASDFPGSLNAALGTIKDAKGVGMDFYTNGVMARLGPYDGAHLIVTPLVIVFLIMGLTRVPWRWVLGLSALDMLVFPPRSLKSPATMLGAYALGFTIRRWGFSGRWRR